MRDGKGNGRGDQSIKVRGIRGYQPIITRARRQWKGIRQLYRVGEERHAELEVNPFREAVANRLNDEGRM